MLSSVQYTWILHLLLLLLIIKGINCYDFCIKTKFCTCEINAMSQTVFKCAKPDDMSALKGRGFEVVLEIYNTIYKIQINCLEAHTFSIEKIPPVQFSNANVFDIKNCPIISSGNNFNDILKKFSVKKIEYIEYSYMPFNKSIHYLLKKHLFKNLTSLNYLYLASSNIQNIELDTFDYVSNLTILDLSNNKIEKLKDDQFKNLKNLISLQLYENGLRRLPNNIFANLKNLKELALANNYLSEFNSVVGLQNLTKLTTIELQNNQISNISENIFENMSELLNIYLSYNPLKKLPNNLFKNNKKLIKLHLTNCKLEHSIPENIFSNLIKLNILELSRNFLKTLPDSIFKELFNLTELHLDDNQLENFSINLFQTLKNLSTLNLEKNFLKSIDQHLFEHLSNLKVLKLNDNKISFIDSLAFSNNLKLENIDVSNNSYSGVGTTVALLSNNFLLKIVNFNRNKIVNIDSIIFVSQNKMSSLQTLDLSFNNIGTIKISNLQRIGSTTANINLNNNNIANVDLDDFLMQGNLIRNPPKNVLSINSILCHCPNFNFLQFLQNYDHSKIKFKIEAVENVTCSQPENTRNILVKNLSLRDITCDPSQLSKLKEVRGLSCPSKCNCTVRPYDKSYIINCSNRAFSTYPAIKFTPNSILNQVELHLEYNKFTSGPSSVEVDYSNVTRLYLSNNYIKNITSIPAKLQVLQLNNNSLERLDDNFLEYLNTSNILNLTLVGNPWICECTITENFAQYLRNHAKQVVAASTIFCANSEKAIIDLNKHTLCKEWQLIALIVAIMSVLVLCASTAAAYYRYQQEIKVWLFSKQLCLWWVTEEEVDKDKLYDAFISFAHEDEDFVMQNLLLVLESGPVPYKVCVHFRDWAPGELITTQITKSVCDSRRTIIVLSSNFVESYWGKREFREAHTQAMTKGHARVIVMLYGDINIESLDEELKAYLNTNTYIKWGDSYFWKKLKYALPHHHKSNKNSQKCSNLINFFHDKFNLVRTSVSSNNTLPSPETPSVIIEQPQRYSLSSNA